MKKALCLMLCILVTVCFVPAMTWATTNPNVVLTADISSLIFTHEAVSDNGGTGIIGSSVETTKMPTVSVNLKAADNVSGNYRFRLSKTSGDGNVQIIARDSANNYYDLLKAGWGPISGFPILQGTDYTTICYIAAPTSGTYTVKVELYEVGNESNVIATKDITVTVYNNLQTAINAAATGATLKLSTDISITDSVKLNDNKAITLDLNGKSITRYTSQSQLAPKEPALTVNNGKLTISNGTVNGRVNAYDYGELTIAKGATVNGLAMAWGDGTFGQGGCKTPTLNIYGRVYNVNNAAVMTNGLDLSKANIKIYDGAEVESTFCEGIYLPSGNLIVTGGTIKGKTAVYFKSTDMTLSGGTFIATGDAGTYTFNGNGSCDTGDAIVIDNCNYPAGTGTITISGGTYSSANAKAVGSYAGNGKTVPLSGFITGGTFSDTSAAKYATADCLYTDNGKYVVRTNIDDAISAAATGSTILLARNINKKVTYNGTKTLSFDLNGKTWTGDPASKHVAFTVNSGDITLKDTATTKGGFVGRVNCYDAGKLTIDGVNITNSNDGGTAIVVWGDGIFGEDGCKTPTLTVKSGTIVGKNYAICTNGEDTSNAVININGGEVSNSNDVAIYAPSGTWKITKGTITGTTALYFKSQKLEISGGTFYGTGVQTAYSYNGNGCIATGDAAVIDNCGYPNGIQNISIKGGTFISTNAKAVGSYASGESSPSVSRTPITGFISGGKYNTSPTAYVASNVSTYFKKDDSIFYVNVVPSHSTYMNAWQKEAGKNYYTEYYYIPYSAQTTTTTTTTATTTTTTQTQTVAKNSGNATIANNEASIKTTNLTTTTLTTSTTTINTNTAKDMEEAAVDGKVANIEINATTTKGTSTTATVDIPLSTVKTISEKAVTDITVNTDVASIVIDPTTQKAIASQAKGTTVDIVAKNVSTSTSEAKFELSITSGGAKISDFNGGNVQVTVEIPASIKSANVVCVFLDDNGNAEKMAGTKNADGTYTFTAGHFSTYAIMTEAAADALIAQNTVVKQETSLDVARALLGIQLKTTTSFTSAKSIKIKAKASQGLESLIAIQDAGYTVEYKFYRSTKKSSAYKAMKTKSESTYTNTTGKKGTKYYYKTRIVVYDSNGTIVGMTALNQSTYGSRVWKK